MNLVSKYNQECERRLSFITFENPEINFDKLALFGFYNYMEPNIVRCAFCRLLMRNYEDPLEKHKNYSMNCPLILKTSENIPISTEIFDKSLPPPTYDCVPFENGDEIKEPKVSTMILESERLKSFANWPNQNPKPEALAAAGFFYSGCDDKGT